MVTRKRRITSVDTVIVGAGISGLACARRLREANQDFLLISKDIGGRVSYSKNNPDVEFGAVYITTDYFNVFPLANVVEKFLVRDFYFSLGNEKYVNLLSPKCWKFYPKILRFLPLLIRFRNHLNRARKKAETAEFKSVIESDPLLLYYWNLPVPEFLAKYGFEDIDYYFGQPNCGTNFFTHSKNLNTFYYFYLFISMIRPTFVVNLSRAITGLAEQFADNILFGEVTSVRKCGKKYLVKTKSESYLTNNVVIAAQYSGISKALNLPKPSATTSECTYFVYGKRKEQYRGKKGVVLHPDSHDAFLLWEQRSGGDIIYSKSESLDLSQYYDSYVIQAKKYWKTAIYLPGKNIIRQNLDDGLYLASDYNFSILEDAYITGLYAANQIVKNNSKKIIVRATCTQQMLAKRVP